MPLRHNAEEEKRGKDVQGVVGHLERMKHGNGVKIVALVFFYSGQNLVSSLEDVLCYDCN